LLAGLQAGFLAVQGAAGAYLSPVVDRWRWSWPLLTAIAWVAQEAVRSRFPFGGFPWGRLAFSQADSPLLALAVLGGAPLVTFAVALAGGMLAAAAWRHWRPAAVTPAAALVAAAVAVMLVGLAVPTRQPDGPAVTVAIVQGNVPRLGLDFNAQRLAVLDNHVTATLALADQVAARQRPQPDLVIWPENSSDIDPLANPDARQQISNAAAAINAPILVGGVVAAPDYSRDNPVSTNSVIVWNPGTGPADRHDKQIVQPFGEYLPWRSFFSHLSKYADRAGYFIPGEGTGVVQAAGVPVGVTTCWEVIFDRAARESVLNGAQVLAVPTNNATFNEAMSEQQLAFGRLRAVEHDRYAVVAGTTGISAVIAPDGHELSRTAFFEPAYLDTQVRLKTQLTPATRWGPVVEGVLVGIGVAAVIAAILHNGSFVRRLRRGSNDEGAT
jgi:apolipoprotein N-acyltransferase